MARGACLRRLLCSSKHVGWGGGVPSARRGGGEDDELAVGAVRLHQAGGVLDLLEPEDPRRRGPVAAGRRLVDDGLERDFGQRELRRPEQEAAEGAEVHGAGDLEDGAERAERLETSQRSSDAHATPTTRECQRIEEGAG